MIPAQTFMVMMVISVVPSSIFMLCVHQVARAMGRRSAWEYAAIGGVAVACTLLLVLVVPSSLPSWCRRRFAAAIMGALYRRFAGLEPMPLPEAVIATDPNALVGATSVAAQHGVILSNYRQGRKHKRNRSVWRGIVIAAVAAVWFLTGPVVVNAEVKPLRPSANIPSSSGADEIGALATENHSFRFEAAMAEWLTADLAGRDVDANIVDSLTDAVASK